MYPQFEVVSFVVGWPALVMWQVIYWMSVLNAFGANLVVSEVLQD